MIPADFSYTRAHSVADALRLLGEHGGDAKILSGGHSLVPAMKLRLNQPGVLIDVARISELRYIRPDGGHIAIGAASTHADIAASELLASHVALFPQAAKLIGDVQVRNRGTIGGSIAHADPVQSTSGRRSIPAADFFTGFYSTALEEGELITEIRVPIPAAGTHSSYQKFMQPASRFAIVGCAAVVTQSGGVCSHVRVAFTGVSDGPFRDANVENALSGKAASADNVAAAAAQAAQGVNLLSDHFASEKYRLHLAQVFAKRALSDVTA